MAEWPHIVRSHIINTKINKSGIYGVVFFVNGKEHAVIVDDMFACNDFGNHHFAQPRNGKLWVMIMEKAWAKMHGSYQRISGGQPHLVWNYFTNMPAYVMSFREQNGDMDKVWDRITFCEYKDYAM